MSLLKPNWPAPASVHAFTTLRFGGVSEPPYSDFNLGFHVGDQDKNVVENRKRLSVTLNLPSEPVWLRQTHSTIVLPIYDADPNLECDAAYTSSPKKICAIQTADCLPILICDVAGTQVAAVHAGWRGLARGIVKNTIDKLGIDPKLLLVWLGPAIGPAHFEVGSEVRDEFIQYNASLKDAFLPNNNNKWLANIYLIAKILLSELGIQQIFGGEYCTFSENDKFFSYRRDGNLTGRMASLIWIQDVNA
jgi:YfiH family protein